jgi:hypothetical protein
VFPSKETGIWRHYPPLDLFESFKKPLFFNLLFTRNRNCPGTAIFSKSQKRGAVDNLEMDSERCSSTALPLHLSPDWRSTDWSQSPASIKLFDGRETGEQVSPRRNDRLHHLEAVHVRRFFIFAAAIRARRIRHNGGTLNFGYFRGHARPFQTQDQSR